MKETKITKRIFAVFVAFIVILLISCGDLQVFADNFTVSYITNTNLYSLSYDYGWNSDFTSHTGGGTLYFNGLTGSFTLPVSGLIRVCFHIFSNSYSVQWVMINSSDVYLSGDPSDPTFISSHDWNITTPTSGRQTNVYLWIYIEEPSTPTPEPTPTPTPTPTPEPTFNPDQPTYTTFFNHLLNDGNNALNALYLSWTSANNKFYTGIFFIGLPIMIGIFGIVASIFFGGDD